MQENNLKQGHGWVESITMTYCNILNIVRKLCGYKFPRIGKRAFDLFFKVVPSTVQCELFPDLYVRLNLHDLTQRSTFWQGERFEFPTVNILESWGGTSFFDIGANYGFYSLFTLAKFRDISVFAFEPNPSTYGHILQIKRDNGLKQSKQFQTFNIGLGSRAIEADLYLGGKDSGHSTFLNHPEFLGLSIGKIKIETFDQWREDQKLDLPKKPEWMAKIDVEGMELDVLVGMEKTLKAKAFKGILVEVLDFTLALANHKPEDIFNFMNSVGYKPIDKANLLRRYGRISTANVFFEPF